MFTTSSSQISEAADMSIGILYLAMFIFGTTGNILGFVWLWSVSPKKHNVLFFRNIYRMVNVVDCMICLSLVPEIESFLRSRSSILFEEPVFCKFWALKWELLPPTSVFMVAVLSISRMISVVRPLCQLNFMALKISMAVHFLVICIAMIAPLAIGLSDTSFLKTDVACSLEPVQNSFIPGNALIFIVELGLPIVPVIVSAVITTIYLGRARKRSARASASVKLHDKATKTVILVTLVYMVCNLPCFVNFVYYLYMFGEGRPEISFRDRYKTTFFRWYVWNLTYIFAVALNSSLNPLVYLVRMKQFRDFILRVCNNVAVMLRHLSGPGNPDEWTNWPGFVMKL